MAEIEAAIAKVGLIELRIVGEFERGATGAYDALTEDGRRTVVKVAADRDRKEKMVFCASYLPNYETAVLGVLASGKSTRAEEATPSFLRAGGALVTGGEMVMIS